MEALTSYFDRLRVLIPARTLALLLIGGTLAQTFADPKKSSTGLIVMSFVILGTCLLLNFLGGMIADKKPWHAALVSCGALILFDLSQRAYGPLGALGVDEPWVYGILAFLAAAYPMITALFYRGAEPAVVAANSAREGLSRAA